MEAALCDLRLAHQVCGGEDTGIANEFHQLQHSIDSAKKKEKMAYSKLFE